MIPIPNTDAGLALCETLVAVAERVGFIDPVAPVAPAPLAAPRLAARSPRRHRAGESATGLTLTNDSTAEGASSTADDAAQEAASP